MKRALLLFGMLAATSVGADTAENFQLLDQHRATHELHWLSDTDAVVIMIQGNGCPIVRNAWPTYQAIRDEYQHRQDDPPHPSRPEQFPDHARHSAPHATPLPA